MRSPRIGIACGLAWTDLADEVWFCLREGDRFSSGMRLALERHRTSGSWEQIRCFYFTQEVERIRDTDIDTMSAQK